VDYEGVKDLFLISITHTETGKEVNIDSSGFKNVNRIEKKDESIKDLLNIDLVNKEGYVVKFNNVLRVKITFDSYVEKHRGRTDQLMQ
jgi:hypothetical protein